MNRRDIMKARQYADRAAAYAAFLEHAGQFHKSYVLYFMPGAGMTCLHIFRRADGAEHEMAPRARAHYITHSVPLLSKT